MDNTNCTELNECQLLIFYLELNEKKRQFEGASVQSLDVIDAYCTLEKKVESLKESIRKFVLKPKHLVPYFQVGRLLRVIE